MEKYDFTRARLCPNLIFFLKKITKIVIIITNVDKLMGIKIRGMAIEPFKP